MSTLEARREQFRRYLEQCGVINSLTKALINLYDEFEKPEDAVRYIRKRMCESCPDDEDYEKLKCELEDSKRALNSLEEELYRFKGNLKRTPSQILDLLESGYEKLKNDEDCNSLLKKYLNDDLYKELIPPTATSKNATLLDIIQSGLDHHDSSVGIYAADEESYTVFNKLFRPIIIDYHKLVDDPADSNPLQNSNDWGDTSLFTNLDPKGKYIVSTRIRVARNIKGFPYFPILSEDEYNIVEEKCKGAFLELKDDLQGTYTTLRDIDSKTYEEMVNKHLIFRKGDVYLDSAGAYRFWPTARGIFRNKTDTFLVWVNEEDHLRIMSMSKSGNLGEVYQRLVAGVDTIGQSIEYARNDMYGYVTACPTNLGTTMRASVHIKLPLLSEDEENLKKMCDELHLQIRGTGGEHTEIVDNVRDISNKQRLGLTEQEILTNFQDAIKKLLVAEKDLE